MDSQRLKMTVEFYESITDVNKDIKEVSPIDVAILHAISFNDEPFDIRYEYYKFLNL